MACIFTPMSRGRTNKKRRWLRRCLLFLFLGVLSILAIDQWVSYSTAEQIFRNTQDVPHRKVGLLLGTSKWASEGQNLFYLARIEAAVELYDAGKIDYILVSGDNGTSYYNEPKQFREDLIKLGIPKEKITLDFAGFRTLDSVVRARAVFGQSEFTVISQAFQNERAITIAKHHGIDAIGYCAADVSQRYGMKTMLREKLARVKMLLDLWTGTTPKFLGEPVAIP